jgi:hypothetical protein
MLKKRYIQYLNLPRIPDSILSKIPLDPEMYTTWTNGHKNLDNYKWSDLYSQELNTWCKEYVCADMYFGFQIMFGHNEMHKDRDTLTKINYVITLGGDNVTTAFYDDQSTLLDAYCIEPHRWHIFKADTYHQVQNLEPGQVRFSVTGRIFS